MGSPAARAQTPTAPSDAEGRELGQRIDALSKQIDELESSKDAAARRGLMEQNWRAMQDYMGWMHSRWGSRLSVDDGAGHNARSGARPGQTTTLPDAASPGAKLVSDYCTQCHAAPPPTLHTSEEWAGVVHRMDLHLVDSSKGVRVPSADQMQTILAYMEEHAR